METTPRGDEYVVSDAVAPNSPCHVSNPDVVSECGLSLLPSSIHLDDETEHDAFFVQTCVEEVENAEYAASQKPLLSFRGTYDFAGHSAAKTAFTLPHWI